MNTVHGEENANDLREIENIYPSNIRKRALRASQRTYLSEVRRLADGLCRERIEPSYINYAFNKFKEGILYYRGDIPYAFSLWKVRNSDVQIDGAISIMKELHIYLLCAKKSDFPFLGLLLNDIEEKCMRENIQFISLIPANELLSEHYKKYGFIEKRGMHGEVALIKYINPPIPIGSMNGSHSGRIRTRRVRRHSTAF
jgi:hypothetical protein